LVCGQRRRPAQHRWNVVTMQSDKKSMQRCIASNHDNVLGGEQVLCLRCSTSVSNHCFLCTSAMRCRQSVFHHYVSHQYSQRLLMRTKANSSTLLQIRPCQRPPSIGDVELRHRAELCRKPPFLPMNTAGVVSKAQSHHHGC
jgi:hypothetical protein